MRASPPSATTTGFHRVLLIDRNVDELRRVRDLLQTNGSFDVAGARDGSEAIALIGQGAFDAVVVDEQTWSSDGVELLRTVRDQAPDLAVLVLAEGHDRASSACHDARRPDGTFFREHLGDGRTLAQRVVTAVTASRSDRSRHTIARWLERDARTDRLTGLHNHAGFWESFAETCARAHENGSAVGLILMHVVGTWSVRQSHGPHERNDMLRRAALGLSRSIRGVDVASRSDQSEFAVVVEGADIDLLMVISRRIAHQIERLNDTDWRQELPIDVEFGFASGAMPAAEDLYATAQAQLTPDDQPRPRVLLPHELFDEDGPSVA